MFALSTLCSLMERLKSSLLVPSPPEYPNAHRAAVWSRHLRWDRHQGGAISPNGDAFQQRAQMAVRDHWQVSALKSLCFRLEETTNWSNSLLFLLLFLDTWAMYWSLIFHVKHMWRNTRSWWSWTCQLSWRDSGMCVVLCVHAQTIFYYVTPSKTQSSAMKKLLESYLAHVPHWNSLSREAECLFVRSMSDLSCTVRFL